MAWEESDRDENIRHDREDYDVDGRWPNREQIGAGAICCGWCYGWFEVGPMRRHVLECPKRPEAMR